ncbi:Uma2 family endonuclease [Phormidium sp. LEGE 05292]|uniref:Uma2 family endonuclease n=1 Tax=[Phormidium] sp. LEGE 05292 TaxID=767427 RepID=UPI00187FF1C2|nr:Uma2 family endonuclease [Phormidium sp. LEGE 05292]MBE9228447.1 Uma2 family endonuclease [Phormidium sp. LEGE 05292]
MTASITTVSEITAKILHHWKPATWEDYVVYRDDKTNNRMRLFFHLNRLLVIDMGWEGINHATINELFSMLFILWFIQKPEQIFSSLGGCLLEKAPKQSGAPDLVLYLGDDYPRWQEGEPRRIDLNRWRVPNLIGEVSDTTLATDLDEKKKLYADMGIPEYWVIDVQGLRVFAFQLDANGKYQECDSSLALAGLPISLLEQTLGRLKEGTNGSAAAWFAQQISSLKTE